LLQGKNNDLAIPAGNRKTLLGWADGKKQVAIKFEAEDWGWSSPFGITDIADFKVKIPNANTHDSYLAGIEVKQEYATTLVFIKKEDKKKPPYRLDNKTSHSFKFMQKVENLVIVSNIVRTLQYLKCLIHKNQFLSHGTNLQNPVI
jgi:hypothetical protein